MQDNGDGQGLLETSFGPCYIRDGLPQQKFPLEPMCFRQRVTPPASLERRQRRVEAIQGIAHRTARRAVRERRPIELPPMSPAERRIVHLYLQDNPKVTTASEGSGDNRRVRISPS